MTFYELATIWTESCLKRKSISVRTKEEYIDTLHNRIEPVIGSIELSRIDGFCLDGLVDSLIASKYSSKTIRNTIGVVRQVMSYAYRKDLIEINPIDKMDDLPRLKQDKSLHYFTPDECKRFLQEVSWQPLVYRAIFQILLYGGCRRGEVCALRWGDVDFDAETITIRRSISRTHEGYVIKDPKTVAGNRTISLPRCCIDSLWDLKMNELVDNTLNSSEYVFKYKDFDFIPPEYVSERFRVILKRHNQSCDKNQKLPIIRLHDLRHTAATLLIAENVDIETVARRLGHSNPSVTLNIYAHPTLEGDKKASKTLENLLR